MRVEVVIIKVIVESVYLYNIQGVKINKLKIWVSGWCDLILLKVYLMNKAN